MANKLNLEEELKSLFLSQELPTRQQQSELLSRGSTQALPGSFQPPLQIPEGSQSGRFISPDIFDLQASSVPAKFAGKSKADTRPGEIGPKEIPESVQQKVAKIKIPKELNQIFKNLTGSEMPKFMDRDQLATALELAKLNEEKSRFDRQLSSEQKREAALINASLRQASAEVDKRITEEYMRELGVPDEKILNIKLKNNPDLNKNLIVRKANAFKNTLIQQATPLSLEEIQNKTELQYPEYRQLEKELEEKAVATKKPFKLPGHSLESPYRSGPAPQDIKKAVAIDFLKAQIKASPTYILPENIAAYKAKIIKYLTDKGFDAIQSEDIFQQSIKR